MTGRQVVHDREGTFWTPERQRDALVVLLTFVTGAVDAIGFTRLGGVFTSVMTGNMVLLGVSAGKGDVSLAIHTGVAFIAFVLGGLAGARVARHATKDQDFWPRPILTALVLELGVLGVFAIWWESVAGAPTGAAQYAMLGVNAVALGIQSAAVLRFGISGLSTTYLTGTLTQLVASLTKRQEPVHGRNVVILLALIIGAGLGASVALYVPRLAPAVPIVVLAFVVGCGEIVFHRRTRPRALAGLARKAV
jgi:uncharacterized membrane protein YoaK (UPF0700 family)